MAGVIRRYGRVVGGGLLLVTVVVAHVTWVRTAERAYATAVADASEGANTSPDDEEGDRAQVVAEEKYRAKGRPRRTGSTDLKVVPESGFTAEVWRATAKHTLELRPGDPLVEDLRVGSQNPDAWLPFEITAGVEDCWEDIFAPEADDERLAQESPESTVHAIDFSRLIWRESNYGCAGEPTAITLHVKDDWLGDKALYDRWTVTFEAPEHVILGIKRGTTLRQSAHSAELLLPAKAGTVVVELLGPAASGSESRSDTEVLTEALQGQQPVQREAFWLLCAVVAVTGCWVVPFIWSWAPSATWLRWTVAAWVGGILTGATLVYALTGTYASLSPWWAYPGRGVFLAVWWWTLLPFLLGVFVVRATTGRAPGARELLPSLAPSALLLVPTGVLAATGRTPMPLVTAVAVAAVTASVAYALRRGALGAGGAAMGRHRGGLCLAGRTGRRTGHRPARPLVLAVLRYLEHGEHLCPGCSLLGLGRGLLACLGCRRPSGVADAGPGCRFGVDRVPGGKRPELGLCVADGVGWCVDGCRYLSRLRRQLASLVRAAPCPPCGPDGPSDAQPN
ncbi:hypothetical protein OG548_14030 [Streptomyces sp. NBC_01356]|uniref:hypothetical protein n=1 Tax=Streptomyces sp. NBC_01356 TaxID=2903836 RepID=UPI002E363340|nr:hypothetical protein [Streptomyces sp. NBC_01356]